MKSRGLKFKDLTPDEFKSLPAQSLVATPESLAKNRDAFAIVGRGIAKATLFCQTSKDACNAVMKKAAPEHYTNQQVAMDTLDVQLGMTKLPGNQFGAHSPKEMQDFIGITLRFNPSFKQFSADQFLTDELIASINQFDQDKVKKMAQDYKP